MGNAEAKNQQRLKAELINDQEPLTWNLKCWLADDQMDTSVQEKRAEDVTLMIINHKLCLDFLRIS